MSFHLCNPQIDVAIENAARYGRKAMTQELLHNVSKNCNRYENKCIYVLIVKTQLC